MIRLLAFSCLLALTGQAQTFDVATIKPAEPPKDGNIQINMRGGPGTEDPERITWSDALLEVFVTTAFGVRAAQVSGPDWLWNEHFAISAKVPSGATKEQVPMMLQHLLIERFKMAFHREKKDLTSYVLTVTRSGSKMTATEPLPRPAPNAPLPLAGGTASMPSGRIGNDGFPELSEYARHLPGPMTFRAAGRTKLVCNSCPIAAFTNALSVQAGGPVVNMTSLTGNFAFTLIFESAAGNMPAGSGRGGMPAAGVVPDHDAAREAVQEASLFSAIQDQLGLRLERKRAPVDVIVIDHIEKTPTEN